MYQAMDVVRETEFPTLCRAATHDSRCVYLTENMVEWYLMYNNQILLCRVVLKMMLLLT